ncbi:histone-lysine N-methyltransferase SETMAR [Trichonephila clavipes]|nr:histone-lysine N-methyltransferase SETMAR [Trichonephila clavipes]
MELTREHYRATIFYDFKPGLIDDECVQRLQLVFRNEFSCRATVFRWFKEFYRGRNSLQGEEHTRRPRLTVIPDNVFTIRKMLMNDNRRTYQMIQKELNIRSAAIHKIIHEELYMWSGGIKIANNSLHHFGIVANVHGFESKGPRF